MGEGADYSQVAMLRIATLKRDATRVHLEVSVTGYNRPIPKDCGFSVKHWERAHK